MASVKVKVRASSAYDKSGTIYYQIIHRRTVKQISTGIRIDTSRWENLRQQQNSPQPISLHPDREPAAVRTRIDSDTAMLHNIINDLESIRRHTGADYTVADIADRFRSLRRQLSVAEFMSKEIGQLTAAKRMGTAINYRTSLESLLGFLDGADLTFPQLTARFVESYDDYLRGKGLVKNSRSFHLRILRAVYNKAVMSGAAQQTHPFINVYTGVDRTRKRAVGKETILNIIGLDLSHSAPLSLARDLFLFSLYTRGMSFVDMAFLKRENIIDGTICYIRRKTKQTLCIRIEPCIRRIIETYAKSGSRYIFPILKSDEEAAAYSQYRVSMAYYNRLLKRLSKMIGLQQGLSFYAARHSWATIARDNNVPVSVISAGMGHSSERTTRIYLTSLENSSIDNANRAILNSLECVHSM